MEMFVHEAEKLEIAFTTKLLVEKDLIFNVLKPNITRKPTILIKIISNVYLFIRGTLIPKSRTPERSHFLQWQLIFVCPSY